jgi:multisubunit Na+/H+ antiporter MnhF subunit
VSGYQACALLLLLGGLGPALALTARGDAVDRLIGAELAAVILTAFLLVFARIAGAANYLILPLFAVPVSVVGTFVYLRCLAPQPAGEEDE